MPICTLHLLTLNVPLSDFLTTLRATSPQPLVTSRVIRWVIRPTSLTVDPLLTQKPLWDLLLIYASAAGLPSSLHSSTSAIFTIQAGVPSSLVSKFPQTNAKLLHPDPNEVPKLTGALDHPRIAESAQSLELTDELRGWFSEWDPPSSNRSRGAVSMLNLLAFHPSKHSEYLKYGKAFAESIGSRRGGNAKIVGRVVGGDKGTTPEEGGWDEVALAHYPSAWHFADMAASTDYQEVNKKFRVGSLRDTCILMTSEIEVERMEGGGHGKAKL